MNDTPELILCIPGPWDSQQALADDIADGDSGHLLIENLLRDAETGFTCELVYGAADPEVSAAFRVAGPHWAASGAMDDVGEHRCVVYLIGKGGSREAAEAMMRAGAALVDAGGLGVKVESTGIAHGPAYWTEMCEQLPLLTAHRALVVFVVSGHEVYSCGMHNFGLPEAVMAIGKGSIDRTAAADLLRTFTRYLLEAHDIEVGHTFSVSEGAPVYRIVAATPVDYGPDSLFNNPYGSWRLEAVAPEKKGNWWGRLVH
ncbi:hypothetical protein G4G28_05155 [Massilia sp. Dwa41.01b]|uniref:DUF4261 domain-containing protein n=1 Tax=unclassified Massilia TaxID=2609279 RepID=UPI001604283B|nr:MULTISPECIES: DUF4261 domain-containing protein [unclassified Massilia]QNA88022.1 hypothetical protein G4G28_05155 [Massilia sp. Dwa41.01b]QNA98923.1 hypothetical protein G4G31_08870 [Massilia sp. Se16.2.3]